MNTYDLYQHLSNKKKIIDHSLTVDHQPKNNLTTGKRNK